MNTTISLDYDVTAFGALRLSPSEFARELRIAAAVQWYAQGRVSQGKAAELAALTRGDFLDELYRRKIPACQVTAVSESLLADWELAVNGQTPFSIDPLP